jgi:hypothetical protein
MVTVLAHPMTAGHQGVKPPQFAHAANYSTSPVGRWGVMCGVWQVSVEHLFYLPTGWVPLPL